MIVCPLTNVCLSRSCNDRSLNDVIDVCPTRIGNFLVEIPAPSDLSSRIETAKNFYRSSKGRKNHRFFTRVVREEVNAEVYTVFRGEFTDKGCRCQKFTGGFLARPANLVRLLDFDEWIFGLTNTFLRRASPQKSSKLRSISRS